MEPHTIYAFAKVQNFYGKTVGMAQTIHTDKQRILYAEYITIDGSEEDLFNAQQSWHGPFTLTLKDIERTELKGFLDLTKYDLRLSSHGAFIYSWRK